jgi:Cdc6-like AAA superfamily ATPase
VCSFAALSQGFCNKPAAAYISNNHIVGPLSSIVTNSNSDGNSNSDDNSNSDGDSNNDNSISDIRNNAISIKKVASSSSIHGSFFDRVHERKQLDALLGQSPAYIQVILGPRSCGKSAFLREYVRQQQQLGSNSICYINCRRCAASTPDSFAELLAKEALPALIQNIGWKRWQQFKEPVLAAIGLFNVNLKLPDGFWTAKLNSLMQQIALRSQQSPKSCLDTALHAYGSLLQSWEAARKEHSNLQLPVLIIDQAEVLQQEWSDIHENDLGVLLRFLVGHTLRLRRCHVVLVTSEYGFVNWLDKSECQ